MQVYYDLKDFEKLGNAIVTSGTFDGVHKGHQKILQRLKDISKAEGGETVVITYWPHPRKVLSDGVLAPKILYSLEERVKTLNTFDINHLIVIHFDKQFAEISSEEYSRKILADRIGTKKLVIGYDHRFGKNREGSFEYLKKNAVSYGFEVEEIPRQDIDDVAVSSSNIRTALAEGAIETANAQLGRPFFLSGKVIKGNQLGRTIGYPTANIALMDEDKILPKDGVYAVHAYVNQKKYGGMLSIGFNPTVNGKQRTIEVNIFDFDRNIYGEIIEIEFVKYLRDEQKFAGLEVLKEQLAKDKIDSLEVLS